MSRLGKAGVNTRILRPGWSCLFFAVLLSTVTCWQTGFAAEALTDGHKKQIVYDMYNGYKKTFPEVQDISVPEAMALMESGCRIFVDSRKAKEQKVSMLPGAITEEAFKKELERYKNHVIIGYCTISYRSGKLAEQLGKKGVKMLNLKGGMLAWILEGGKVYDQHGETKQVHVYSKKWNYVPEGYEAVW